MFLWTRRRRRQLNSRCAAFCFCLTLLLRRRKLIALANQRGSGDLPMDRMVASPVKFAQEVYRRAYVSADQETAEAVCFAAGLLSASDVTAEAIAHVLESERYPSAREKEVVAGFLMNAFYETALYGRD